MYNRVKSIITMTQQNPILGKKNTFVTTQSPYPHVYRNKSLRVKAGYFLAKSGLTLVKCRSEYMPYQVGKQFTRIQIVMDRGVVNV